MYDMLKHMVTPIPIILTINSFNSPFSIIIRLESSTLAIVIIIAEIIKDKNKSFLIYFI